MICCAHTITRNQAEQPSPITIRCAHNSREQQERNTMKDLQAINDWLALCEAKARYCRLLDTKDWEAFANLFIEDYLLDTSGSGGPVISGRDAAMKSVRTSLATAKTAHQVHSPEIEINGDEARVIWAMRDRVVWSNDRSLTGYGHYHERWVRRNGEWKIATLSLTRLQMDMQMPTSPQ
jgi:hypothetical protein